MKNKMTDLNNVLFEQLERLQDDEAMKDDQNFKREIERSRAIVGVSSQIPTGRTGQFRRGQPTWNKGKHFCAGGRSIETQFKKGHIPKQWRPVGSERVNKDGYIEIKVKEPRTWMLKHRYIWQQHHGEVPKGSMVVFKDGNRKNTDISNLLLITRGLNARLTKMGLQGAREAGAIEQAVMAARLEEKIVEMTGRKDTEREEENQWGKS